MRNSINTPGDPPQRTLLETELQIQEAPKMLLHRWSIACVVSMIGACGGLGPTDTIRDAGKYVSNLFLAFADIGYPQTIGRAAISQGTIFTRIM